MNNLKKNENKGFTLVELIVVLVILAILAAILVPALLGYIDRAKEQQIVLNARSCYTAAQAELSSMYGTGTAPSNTTLASGTPHATRIIETADVNCTSLIIGTEAAYNSAETDKSKIHKMYTVTYVAYEENGKTIYLINGEWTGTAPASVPAANGTQYYKIK